MDSNIIREEMDSNRLSEEYGDYMEDEDDIPMSWIDIDLEHFEGET